MKDDILKLRLLIQIVALRRVKVAMDAAVALLKNPGARS